MVYKLIQDECNNLYEELINIALKYSEHFGCCTFKSIHKKDLNKSYFEFFEKINDFAVDAYEFTLPQHYRNGQKFHVFELNSTTKNCILNIGSFDNWYIYDSPEDLAFYHNKKVWFNCISHERLIFIDTNYTPILEEISSLGLSIHIIE